MANKKSNTNIVTVESLLKQATEPSKQTAEAFHELWETGKRELDRADQARLWEGLKALRKNDFAGKKWRAAHPDADNSVPWVKAPAPKKHPVPAPKAPAKQEKKAKAPTTKEMLASMLLSMQSMDKSLRDMNGRLDSLESRVTCVEVETAGLNKRTQKQKKSAK